MDIFALPPLVLSYACAAVLVGAVVRGFTGFGSSLLWVSSLTLVLPPAEVVPMVLMFEVAASAALLPAVWRQVHWRSLVWIVLGTLVATPFGIYLLVVLSADAIRLWIGVIVLVASVLIWRGARTAAAGPMPALLTGLGAGLLNGSTAIGGPPVILFYFGSTAAVAVGRATIIAFFLASDSVGAGLMATQGLVTATVLWRWLLFLPLVGLGIWLGHRRFLGTEPETVRRLALGLLAIMALALLLRAGGGIVSA